MAIASRWLHFAPVFTSSSRVAGSRYLYIAGSLLCSLSFGFPFDKLKCGWLMPPAGTSQRGCCRPGWQRCSQRRALEETEGRRERERERERERKGGKDCASWLEMRISLSFGTDYATYRAGGSRGSVLGRLELRFSVALRPQRQRPVWTIRAGETGRGSFVSM